jgi:hypothetical protein
VGRRLLTRVLFNAGVAKVADARFFYAENAERVGTFGRAMHSEGRQSY